MSDDPRIDRLNKAVFGNGRPGLVDRVETIEGAFFKNERTGDIGVLARLKNIESLLTRQLVWVGLGGLIVGGLVTHFISKYL